MEITILTIIARLIAIFIGIENIKLFTFKKISLILPKSKEKFIQRVKNLSLAKSNLTLIFGTTIIAATVNI